MLRDSSAWIGVRKDNGATRVSMTNGLTMDEQLDHHRHRHRGGRRRRLRRPDLAAGQRRHPARLRPARPRSPTAPTAAPSPPSGPAFTLNNDWQFFMGYRFGIFNYATQALGGAVTVTQLRPDHTLTAPSPVARQGVPVHPEIPSNRPGTPAATLAGGCGRRWSPSWRAACSPSPGARRLGRDHRHQRLVRAGQPQQRQGAGRLQPGHHRRRPDHPVGAQRRRPAAVAVRRLRRRLLPAEVAAVGQGPRRLQPVHRRRWRRSCSGPTTTPPTSSSASRTSTATSS